MESLHLSLVAFLLCTPTSNLLRNPGFEEAGGWHLESPVWSMDQTIARSGRTSLKYKNDAPNLYKLVSQVVPVRSGSRYRISGWVKVENVRGPAPGATIALEWLASDGEFLGGCYPGGVTGAQDWTRIETVSAVVPAQARSARLVCYVAKGAIGTAWFDDLELTLVQREDWHVALLRPWFRNRLDDAGSIRVEVRLPGHLLEDGDVLCANVKGPGLEKVSWAAATEKTTLGLEVADIMEGTYALRIQWLGKGERPKRQTEFALTKGRASRSLSFEAGVLKLRGKTFFPVGIYDSEGWMPDRSPNRLARIAEAGFNCVIPYGLLSGSVEDVRRYLDTAARLGLRVIVSLKDLYDHVRYPLRRFNGVEGKQNIAREVVSSFGGHPALLAWYVNDESGPEHVQDLRALYETVVSLDPEHPCFAVTNQPESAYEFLGTTDVLGVDPYPVPGSPLGLVRDWIKPAIETERPVWCVVQAFDKSHYAPGKQFRFPTQSEYRAMVFLALASGATGVFAYSYHDILRDKDSAQRWKEVAAITRELRRFSAVVSQGVPLPLSCEGADARLWKVGRDQHVLLVNATARPATASLYLPSFSKCIEGFGRKQLSVRPGQVRRYLPPYGVEWLILEP